MQNKPNLREAQMNVNKVSTKDYENKRLCRRRENKPNQTQFLYQYAQNKANFNTKYAKQSQFKPNFKRGTYAAEALLQERFPGEVFRLTIGY